MQYMTVVIEVNDNINLDDVQSSIGKMLVDSFDHGTYAAYPDDLIGEYDSDNKTLSDES